MIKRDRDVEQAIRQMRLHPAIKFAQMISGVGLEKCKQRVIGGGSKEMAMRRKPTEVGNYEPQ